MSNCTRKAILFITLVCYELLIEVRHVDEELDLRDSITLTKIPDI